MGSRRDEVSQEIRDLLEMSGVPWEIVPGTRHIKIFVAGRMVQTVPRGRNPSARTTNRSDLNALASVRRAIKRARDE